MLLRQGRRGRLARKISGDRVKEIKVPWIRVLLLFSESNKFLDREIGVGKDRFQRLSFDYFARMDRNVRSLPVAFPEKNGMAASRLTFESEANLL